MIMPSTDSTLNTNGDTTSFGIEMNSSMFQMLTKNVYNDVILAPIREFSTNAIDACIEAGNDIDFDVHLPTSANPVFSVRDYGTGLSHEDVIGLFSLLGASTKRNSNKYNGTFGIGRMAGLAYSSSFTIDSYKDGKHASYIVSVKNGIPNTIHLGNVSTKEHNGLKLSIKVKPTDISTFLSKATQLYTFFEHKPNLNYENIDLNMATIVKGTDWYIPENNKIDSATVLMGNVPYRIGSHSLNNKYYNVISTRSVIEVPLGAVSITPGRESLTFDEKTIKYIEKRFDDLLVELPKKALASIDYTKKMYPKIQQINNVIEALPYTFKHLIKANLSQEEQKYFYNRQGSSIELSNNFKSPGSKVTKLEPYYKVMRKLGSNYYNTSLHHTKFMIADTRIHIKEAAVAYKKSFESTPVVIVIQMEKYKKDNFDTFIDNTKDFCDTLGIPYTLTSEWNADIAVKERKTLKGFHPIIISSDNSIDTISTRRSSKEITSYNTEKVFYVETSNFDLINDTSAKVNLYDRYLRMYNKEYGTTYQIIGIPKKYKNIVKDNSDYKHIDEIKNLPKQIHFYDTDDYSLFQSHSYSKSTSSITTLADTVKNKEFKEYLHSLAAFKEILKYPNVAIEGITDEFSPKVKTPISKHKWSIFIKKYPLLRQIIKNFTATDIARYIELEDNYNEICTT